MRIREITQARVRYGYRKIQVLLNREGWGGGETSDAAIRGEPPIIVCDRS
jgi:hypothetical protein